MTYHHVVGKTDGNDSLMEAEFNMLYSKLKLLRERLVYLQLWRTPLPTPKELKDLATTVGLKLDTLNELAARSIAESISSAIITKHTAPSKKPEHSTSTSASKTNSKPEYSCYADWYDNGPGSEAFKRSCR